MAEHRASDSQGTSPKLTRLQNLIQMLKYLLFSGGAGLIQVGSFTFLNEVIHWPYWLCYFLALTMSVLFNITVNRRFTFKSVANIPTAMLKVLGYYLIFAPVSTWWTDALGALGWNEYLVLFGTMVVNFVTEFLFWRFFVFGKTINTNDLAEKERQAAEEKEWKTN